MHSLYLGINYASGILGTGSYRGIPCAAVKAVLSVEKGGITKYNEFVFTLG